MRFRSFAAVVAFSVIPLGLGCANSEVGPGSEGTGGTSPVVLGTGGSSSGSGGGLVTGGFTGTGGVRTTGGGPATGGSPGSTGQGGASATGGSTGEGGATATGGRAAGSGGAPTTGGSTGAAGSSVTGAGGQVSTGAAGSTATGTGGHVSTGAGGSTVTGTGGHVSSGNGGSSAGGTGVSTGAAGSTATGTGGHVATGTGGTGSTTSTAAGTIVPLYTDPSDPSWNAIISAAEAHPTVHVVAIVNPSDGPGGSKSSAYTTGIAGLQAAGIEVIGYVATGYASHSIASMEAEIDTWKSFYPTLQGIFFDEQSNSTADVAHYQTLSQYAKSVGLNYTVGNPGTGVPTAYVGAVDTMLIYESDGVPPMSDLSSYSAYAKSNFGVIPYAVSAMNSTFVQQARQYVQYIYLTNDDLPNPWDSLSSYFSSLLAALE